MRKAAKRTRNAGASRKSAVKNGSLLTTLARTVGHAIGTIANVAQGSTPESTAKVNAGTEKVKRGRKTPKSQRRAAKKKA